MRVFCDNKSRLTVADALKMVAFVVLFYVVVWELAAEIGRQAGIW